MKTLFIAQFKSLLFSSDFPVLYYHFDLPFFKIIDQRHLPMQKQKYQTVDVHILHNKKQQCIYLFLLLSAAPLRGHQNRSFVSLPILLLPNSSTVPIQRPHPSDFSLAVSKHTFSLSSSSSVFDQQRHSYPCWSTALVAIALSWGPALGFGLPWRC